MAAKKQAGRRRRRVHVKSHCRRPPVFAITWRSSKKRRSLIPF